MHALAGQVGRELLARFIDFGLMALAYQHRFDKAREAINVLRAENHIDMRKFFHKLRAISLADAATNAHDALVELAAFRKRNILHRGDLSHKPCVGCFAHAACDEYDDFGFFQLRYLDRTERFEHTSDSL